MLGLCGGAPTVALSIPETPALVSYESIAGTKNARRLIFDGATGRPRGTVDVAMYFGGHCDCDRARRAYVFFAKLHLFLV